MRYNKNKQKKGSTTVLPFFATINVVAVDGGGGGIRLEHSESKRSVTQRYIFRAPDAGVKIQRAQKKQ